MEKKKPHYDLATIQADVARLGASAFTKSAMDGGRALGLSTTAMLQVISQLSRKDFYKSMTTHADHTIWQDVYYPASPSGVELYVKVTYRLQGPPVISFKRRTE
ncbi:type II toxin-antitoxin system MqsR family toxin [Pseudomonas aeruginosa]|uniref:type II toxin-antitoxin system MqsR family toxin n=1 Tax=Stutzerimonas stutzeri TaxID=316 RepID=UPI000D2145BE|nr:type II toxin-antitoxin system MqsR family toxin [Stutzerimonas stutzeri]AVX11483.1 type II toxin-antitoxin system MqsR family toxin [Stutzerimonas stutzeri]RRW29400.1 type II toxin-antitoxin system MqsR family toxin [Stutzerimonas stutzeri]UUC83840.1 type II toxin-antitoxin system MqsR family toxin [Stutzerimonas stutzeri]